MTLTPTQALFASAALAASPVVAQEIAPPVSAPPAQETPAPAPTPVQTTPARPPSPTTASSSPTTIRPEALAVRDEAREAAQAENRAARRAARATRPAAAGSVEARTPAAVRAAAPQAATPAPAPAATTPVPVAPTPEAAAPAAETAAPAPTAPIDQPAQDDPNGAPSWLLLAILGAGVLAVLAFLALRRGRRAADEEPVYEAPYSEQPVAAEPAYVEPEPELRPQPAAAPIVASEPARAPRLEPEVAARREHVLAAGSFGITAPVIKPKRPPLSMPPTHDATPPMRAAPPPIVPAAQAPTPAVIEDAPMTTPDDVSIAQAEAEDVASLTAAAPVTDRPWLEFAMRPVRAGTRDDEALVEIELTVANAGTLPAEDVRISTFMLPASSAGDMDRMLSEAPTDNAVQSATIEPGEGTRIDATLALRQSDIGGAGEGFTPVVVADARYRLPDGTEGRTAASFIVGRSNGSGRIMPFTLGDTGMHEEIEAQLMGEPERA